jgi:CRISPR-associated protein Cas1
MLALENETEILFLDGTGFPRARIWSHRYGSIASIRKNQARFSQSPEAVSWLRQWIARKIENQSVILNLLQAYEPDWEIQLPEVLKQLQNLRSKVLKLQGQQVSDIAASLRGLEGSSGRAYFQAIGSFLPEQFRFEKRSRQPAEDMFNAMLNYGYGLLYGRVEGALIKAGLDPFLGIFHRDEYNRPVLVYDFIEPFRVWIEYVVIRLCLDRVIFKEFFTLKEEGGYWLNASGKRILVQSINDYLEEVVTLDGLSRSRLNHLEREAREFAATLKGKGEDPQPPWED